ncbi:MAG: type II and III secretion system protein family protein [Paracoccaceae bacterium]
MKRTLLLLTPIAMAILAALQPVTADAQSVLKVARGLQSNNVGVFVNRAVVLESAIPFVEVSVANPDIADVQPISNRSIYIFGRRRGVTSLTLLGENGKLITNVLVKVESDHAEMKQRLRELLPNEPIEVRTAGGGLILSGTISGKAKIDKAMSLAQAYAGDAVTNMMTVGGTQQVMLKVKVAEINRGSGKDLGVSIGALGRSNRTGSFGISGSNVRSEDTDNDGTDDSFINTITGAGAFGGSFGAIISIANSFLLDVQIDALETKGFARTLSEPNLVSLSGVQASFLAGGEVPIPVVGDDGDVSVEFKPVGVNLTFLPRVLDDDLINVAVSAEVSQVDPNVSTVTGGIEVVGFQTRRANTTVELRDGQAFAIAGLLQEDFTDAITQVPWLGDIPVLGTLFRSTNFTRGQTELMIFVSVHLVTPVSSEDDLSLPTDRIGIPNEAELFLLGSPAGAQTLGGSGVGLTGTGFDGDYGYVVE